MRYTVSIKKRGTFKYLLNSKNMYKGKCLVVYSQNSKKDINSIGICVSKKNGNSVNRNKLKRWVREVYKVEETKLKKGYIILFMYKNYITVDKTDYFIVKEDITKGLKSLNIYD